MIDPRDTGIFAKDVGRRLVETREALGLNQSEFGAAARISQPRMSSYESGDRLLTLLAALNLCEAHGLTLDWLYRGDPSGLSVRLNEAMRERRRSSHPAIG